LTQRFLEEQAEFAKPRILQQDEQVGRVSGSLEWRQTRGETGSAPATLPSLANPDNLVFDLGRPDAADNLRFLGCARRVLDAHTGQDALQLTPKQNDQTGGVCIKNKMALSQGFACEFSFAVRNAGADGFALVFHNAPSGVETLGRGGSDLGYGGIPNSVAVEFDTFENADRTDDPNDNHIRFAQHFFSSLTQIQSPQRIRCFCLEAFTQEARDRMRLITPHQLPAPRGASPR